MTEGELWTREQLALLRTQGFRPRAFARFLAASQRRANDVRRARPELARQERRWATAGAAVWLALAAGGIEPFRRRLAAGLGGWSATILMLDWHLGMVETPDGRPRLLGPADAATLVRAWIVPAVADRPVPGLCALGFATDVLDGRLARAAEPTRLGRDLEGVADAVFAAAVLRGARRGGVLARASALAESVRVGLGVGYGVAVYFGAARAPDRAVLEAGRLAAPLRAVGVVAASAGRRRLGSALLLVGSVASVAGLGGALLKPADPASAAASEAASRAPACAG